MNIRFWFILITYLIVQFSIFIGGPLLLALGLDPERVPAIWSIISFTVGLIIIILLLIPEMRSRHEIEGRSTRGQAILWGIIGVFMVFAAQYAAAISEVILFGIEPGSENTAAIVEVAKTVPAFIIVISIIGPILEEIVFRFVIFGALYKRFNFFISALVSSLIFAVVHFEFVHLLIYASMGFVFAYLYVKTKRIIVPIIAHVSLNLFVSLINVVFADRIGEIVEQLDQSASFIMYGGLFL